MSTSRAALALVVLATAAVAVAPSLSAQAAEEARPVRVTGTIVDSESGTPLVGALVRLLTEDRLTLTDETGGFVLEDVTPGPVELEVEQLGYEAVVVSGRASEGGEPLLVTVPPLPVVLDGLRVMVDRLEARRRAVPFGVRVLDADDLSTSGGNLYDIIGQRMGVTLTNCRGRTIVDPCIRSRGGVVRPGVYLDDHPIIGGFATLRMYHPAEVYAVEMYSGGRQIRVYTRHFMERIARQPRALVPVWPSWF